MSIITGAIPSKGFFGKNQYCLQCETSFDHDDLKHHPCRGRKCYACHQTDCADFKAAPPHTKAAVPCNDCHRQFFGPTCLKNHTTFQSADGKRALAKNKSNNVCHSKRKCKECGRLLTPYEVEHKHTCDTWECPSCRRWVNLYTHQCYIQNPKELNEHRKKQRQCQKDKRALKRRLDGSTVSTTTTSRPVDPKELVFVDWDTETMQHQGIHIPNLVCARTSNSDQDYKFEWEGCIQSFLAWLYELAKDVKIIAVAHNSQGFDSYLIIDALYQQAVTFDQVVVGAKIMHLKIHGQDIEFKDCYCFIQQPLSAFPNSFGIEEEKKGFFPHFFNVPDHQQYVGPIPAKDYYDPDSMKPARKSEFDQWYDEKKNNPDYVFDFQKELIAYCQSDVKSLQKGRQVFCQEFEEVAGFNLFEKCLTIASACNLYYRRE